MERAIIKIGGMHCVRCSASIEKSLSNIQGVVNVKVNYANEKAIIEYDSNVISYKEICKIIKKTGFYVLDENNKDKEFKITLYTFICAFILTIPFLIMMVLMFAAPSSHVSKFFHNGVVQVVFATPIQFIAGYKFYKGAFSSLKNKSPNMDLLVSLGTSVAYFYSLYNLISGVSEYYFESCAFVITLVYLGKLLEMKSKNKTNEALKKLMGLKPSKVTVVKNNKEAEIDVEDLKEGDIFLVRNGENIAADGVVVKGSGSVNESMITGESLPKHKMVGDKVIGGTLNVDGFFEVKVSKVGEEAILANIIKLVEEAESSKAKIQRLADKVSSFFVPCVVIIAILAFVINYLISFNVALSISRLVAVLVIACPCSLGLATPTAIIVGMGIAARKGIMIKDASVLEKMCKLETIVLDKTGTITRGELEVSDVEIYNYDEIEFEKIVSSIEKKSNHPISKAIVNSFKESDFQLSEIKEIPGLGIEGMYQGKRVKLGSYNYLKEYCAKDIDDSKIHVYVVIDEELVGVITLEDSVKGTSIKAINMFKESNVEVVLASGDSKMVCEEVANIVGIDNVYSEVLPSDKYKIVNEYKKYGLVAMVGDGVNDAPALASSDVGIAMGNGVDVAINSGDVVIMNDDLSNVYKSYVIAQATMLKIKQNLFWAFFYNCVGIPLAFCGLLSPVIAGLCMSLSSVSVVCNSLLLNKIKV